MPRERGPPTSGGLRLTRWLYDELAHPDSPLWNLIASASAQDLFDRNARVIRAAATPATVRRAEAFMRCKFQGTLEQCQCGGMQRSGAVGRISWFRGMWCCGACGSELAHQDIMPSDRCPIPLPPAVTIAAFVPSPTPQVLATGQLIPALGSPLQREPDTDHPFALRTVPNERC
jgi:hypothetical protein